MPFLWAHPVACAAGTALLWWFLLRSSRLLPIVIACRTQLVLTLPPRAGSHRRRFLDHRFNGRIHSRRVGAAHAESTVEELLAEVEQSKP